MDDFPYESEFRAAMAKVKAELHLAPGDLYEDCSFHPVVCVEVDSGRDEIFGISLIDGSYMRNCSLRFCGVRKLTIAQAWKIRRYGPADPQDQCRIPSEKQWWKI